MRLLALGAALGLAACSGLPPEPLLPLAAGDVAGGLTLDMPVTGDGPGGLSLWGGVGMGGGVDVAFNADAPFSLIAELGAVGRGERPFLPPGVAVRKSFPSGVGVGVGIASMQTALEPIPPERGLTWLTVGPFASVGSTDPDAVIAARATVRGVYEVRILRQDSTADIRRGFAFYGTGALGPVLRSDSSFVVPGGRVIVGGRSLGTVGVAAGPFVEGVGASKPLSAR